MCCTATRKRCVGSRDDVSTRERGTGRSSPSAPPARTTRRRAASARTRVGGAARVRPPRARPRRRPRPRASRPRAARRVLFFSRQRCQPTVGTREIRPPPPPASRRSPRSDLPRSQPPAPPPPHQAGFEFQQLLDQLPADEPRYFVLDWDGVTKDGRQVSKIFFVSWVPDTCKAKTKMLYASSSRRCATRWTACNSTTRRRITTRSPRRNSTNARDSDEFAAKPIFESGGEDVVPSRASGTERAPAAALRNRVVSLAGPSSRGLRTRRAMHGGRRADAPDDVMRVQIPF